jgi:hypothetical protein
MTDIGDMASVELRQPLPARGRATVRARLGSVKAFVVVLLVGLLPLALLAAAERVEELARQLEGALGGDDRP